MNDTVKLIIEIPKDFYEITKAKVAKNMTHALYATSIANGTPLDSNSERAEIQAYFDGEAYGWVYGRNALIEDLKAEFIKLYPKNYMGEPELGGIAGHFSLNNVLKILDNIGKGDKE